ISVSRRKNERTSRPLPRLHTDRDPDRARHPRTYCRAWLSRRVVVDRERSAALGRISTLARARCDVRADRVRHAARGTARGPGRGGRGGRGGWGGGGGGG